MLSAEDLVRFYEVYLVVKDTQQYAPATRPLSIQAATVETLAIFLGATLSSAFLMILSLANCHHSLSSYHHTR